MMPNNATLFAANCKPVPLFSRSLSKRTARTDLPTSDDAKAGPIDQTTRRPLIFGLGKPSAKTWPLTSIPAHSFKIRQSRAQIPPTDYSHIG